MEITNKSRKKIEFCGGSLNDQTEPLYTAKGQHFWIKMTNGDGFLSGNDRKIGVVGKKVSAMIDMENKTIEIVDMLQFTEEDFGECEDSDDN